MPLVTMEVNYEELQNFIKECFEEEYGVDTIVDVEAVKYNPDIIDITVYVKEKKDSMRNLGYSLRNYLKSQGIRTGIGIKEVNSGMLQDTTLG
jgi:translation elongation factor EF-1beta